MRAVGDLAARADPEEPVELRAENKFSKRYEVEQTNTVSTIGAGDNFNAGFIYGLLHYGITRADIERGLTEAQWDEVIACAQKFSANCCKSIYNYVSKEFGANLKTGLDSPTSLT